MPRESRGFLEALVDDGRPLISLTGLCLALSGAFALFQSATGHFLPHDTGFLQMAPQELCGINECRIVHFMFHDRVSFGGALIAIAVLYLWLAAFPLVMVGAVCQRNRGVWQFPNVPGLWLSRHVAWCRHTRAAALFCRRTLEVTPIGD